ncbi:MAG: hypothetical protein LHV68_07985 [Elusimicrobia bacterium]|nr:hypothetical protein [Candidatus Liberimonas magnetica]
MSFNNIINQDKAKQIVLGQLGSKRIPHAYLFLGPDGVGRKKFALELAKILNCKGYSQGKIEACNTCIPCNKINNSLHPDVQIIDFNWQARLEDEDIEKQKALKIDTIRAVQKEVSLKPSESKWKIFILEPAEKITTDAANCLLKTLEEPPQWTIIILLALHKDNLPATVVSRTQIVIFNPLSEKEISGFLIKNYSLSIEKAGNLARICEGSIADAVFHMEEDLEETSLVWQKIKNKSFSTIEAMSFSQKYSKTPFEFLSQLLMLVKQDFRQDPSYFRSCVETVLNSLNLLEANVNGQMALDLAFLKLKNNMK